MNLLSEGAISQGIILASLIGGFALAVIGQLVSAFPGTKATGAAPGAGPTVGSTGTGSGTGTNAGGDSADAGPGGRPVGASVTRFAVAATVMMVNVWSGIFFFMDDGRDRVAIAAIFYVGLFVGVVFFGLGMVEMVAIRAHALRRPILIMFVALLLAELALAVAFLR